MGHVNLDDIIGTYISQKDASDFLKCSERTILRYRQRGVLPFVKIKNRVCFKIEDVSKLHITNKNTTINAKIVQRLEFAEQEIRMLKSRLSLLEAVNGFNIDEITTMEEHEIIAVRDKFTEIISMDKMRWSDLESWARDSNRISTELYIRIGLDVSKICIEKMIALLGFYKRKSASVLKSKLKLKLHQLSSR